MQNAVRNAVEGLFPPSAAILADRLDAARRALLTAQGELDQAEAARDDAYGQDDGEKTAGAVLKAESDCVKAQTTVDRAAGRVQALEARLAAAQAAEASSALQAGREQLQVLVAERQVAGGQILKALDQLGAAVAAFDAIDAKLHALPQAVRGTSAEYGPARLRSYISVELAQRDIVGRPNSLDVRRLADWLRQSWGA